MSEATPRVTQRHLEQYSHQTVRLLGKVTELRGESATIDAGGRVTVYLNRESHLKVGNAVEVIGKVQNDLSVKVMASTDFGPEGSIDFNAVDAVVDATHRYHEIFYNKEQM